MKCLLACLAFFVFSGACAQIKLYVSKSTGQFSEYTGDYTKTTDRYEKGSLTYTLQGPIKATVNPSSIAINPNETKTWYGKIYPDLATAPPPGKSAPAALHYNATTQFSRPTTGTTSSGQTIASTYTCPGCAAHPDGGQHEIVNKTTTGQLGFVVYTLGLKFTEPDCAYKGSSLKITATGYPEGGTYEWKSLSPTILQVTGNGAEGSITCMTGGGIGTGKIEISYKINNVIHKVTKDITFFLLTPVLSKTSVCDGEGIEVTLKPTPNISPNRVKQSIANLEIKSLALVGKDERAINIVNMTEISFLGLDGNLKAKAPIVYWFIPDKRKTKCLFNSQYEIWAEGDNNADAGRISTTRKKLTASVDFKKKCVSGHADIELQIPDLNKPVYKNPKFVNGVITFDQPEGAYPGFSIAIVATQGNVTKMQAKFTVGNFKLGHFIAVNTTNPASQFFPLVEFEENFHVAQFGGQTQIQELAGMLSAEDVIKTVNANLPPKSFGPNGFVQAFNQYTQFCWLKFIQAVAKEVMEFNTLKTVWARTIRCRLEQEAKDALKAQFGDIFIADMPCAYPNCPQK